jgi:hypothetical protein
MIKLTVIYTLPEGADHEAFLKWRTTEHQEENMGIPGVIKSDFYAVREIYTPATEGTPKLSTGHGLEQKSLDYRYMTEAYWPDMKSFKSAFFDSGYQKRLKDSLKRIAHPLFFVSEEVLSAANL